MGVIDPQDAKARLQGGHVQPTTIPMVMSNGHPPNRPTDITPPTNRPVGSLDLASCSSASSVHAQLISSRVLRPRSRCCGADGACREGGYSGQGRGAAGRALHTHTHTCQHRHVALQRTHHHRRQDRKQPVGDAGHLMRMALCTASKRMPGGDQRLAPSASPTSRAVGLVGRWRHGCCSACRHAVAVQPSGITMGRCTHNPQPTTTTAA